jgi:nitroreductase
MSLKEIINSWKKPIKFKSDTKISKKTFIKIIEAARWAPSAENQQVWDFLIIDEEQKKKIIIKSVKKQDKRLYSTSHKIEKPILSAKFTFSIKNFDSITDKYKDFIEGSHKNDLKCIETASTIMVCFHSKKYLGNIFGMTDIGASIQNIILISENLGLKVRWIRNFDRELIEDKFKIPEKFIIDALLAIGEPEDTDSTPEYALKEISTYYRHNEFNKDFRLTKNSSKEEIVPNYRVKIEDAILDRRSIRDFKENKKVPDQIIEEILSSGMMVPLTISKPYLRFIVVDDSKILKKIADTSKIVVKQKHVQQVPLIIVATYDCSNNSPAFYAETDTGAIIQNHLLRAHSIGIGSCWIGAFSRKNVRKILNIPEDWHIPTLAIFGYPNNYPKPTPRKEVGRISFYNSIDQEFKKRKRSFFPSYHFISIGIRKMRDTRVKTALRKRKVGLVENIPEFKQFI